MNLYCWLALFFILSLLAARSFCYFGMSRNVDTGEEVDSAASTQDERALAAAWARRFEIKDMQ
jgi:hypothetical protein